MMSLFLQSWRSVHLAPQKTAHSASGATLKPGLSIWLDLIRVIAAFAVLLSHFAYPRFTDGQYLFLREWSIGSDAVIIFFVVSGAVIAYVADRDQSGARFLFNRLTRLWSVLIPAILLTVVFDEIGLRLDPTAYPARYYEPHSLFEMLWRGGSFTNEFFFPGPVRLGTNGPLWSLSYEAAYYAIFGVTIFLKGGMRVGVLAVLLVLAGPRIILLMPAWLMGVWFWRQVSAGNLANLSTSTAWAFSILGPSLYLLCHAYAVPERLGHVTALALNVTYAGEVLRFSDEFVWNALIGVFTTLHLVGMTKLLEGRDLKGGGIKWLAGASFSIYVTHYPALHLLDAALPTDMMLRHAALLIGSIVVGLLFAEIFERRLGQFRNLLKKYATKTAPT